MTMNTGGQQKLIKEIFEIVLSVVKSRIFILGLICAILMSVLVYRVFNLQIVNSDKYVSEYNQQSEKTRYYTGTRGNIYDAEGNLLAYNKPIYSVTIEDTIDSSNMKNEQLNNIVYKTITLIEKNGDSIIDDFVIIADENGTLSFSDSYSENTRLLFLKNIYGVTTLDTEDVKHSEESAYVTYKYLRDEKYQIDKDKYTQKEILKIMMIRYNLSLNAYQKYISTTIAKDVSEETVAAIYESELDIPGVKIAEDTVRVYNNSIYFSHILGYTGKISEEELVSLNAEITDDKLKYQLNDIVGKSGIESSLELSLSGTKGYDKVVVNTTGKVLSVDEYVEPQSGNDVYLTIKSDLQIGIYHLIEEHLAGILLEKIVNHELSQKEKEEWMINIKTVYFQMINNNVVDISVLNDENSTENERQVYDTMYNRRDTIIQQIDQGLHDEYALPLNQLSDEWNEYYTFIFNKLVSDGVILKDRIPSGDLNYAEWMRDKLSLRTMLLYLVSNNWIDTSLLPLSGQYSETGEIYDAIIEYVSEDLVYDSSFTKLVYKYLIFNGYISGNQICMLLFDQNIIEYDDNMYVRLKNSMYSPYTFMMEQIEALNITPAQIALTPCSASCTIVEPETGKVLALVSYPSYDNNIFSGSIDTAYWRQLSEDLSSPLYSRATKMRTAPGSTFKMLSSVVGLEEGVITPTSIIHTTGIYETVNPSPKCWIYPGSHGNINVTKAIEVSCNCYFYEVGYRVSSIKYGVFNEQSGIDVLEKYGEKFGLTSKSGVEVEEYSPLFTDSAVIASFIGQGTNSFTGVQLARYVNTIAADGLNSELTLIKSIKNTNGDVISLARNEHNMVDVSEYTLETIKKGMSMAGQSYSAFKNLSFSVSAKTGTAQENANYPDHALCVGYAPSEQPEISFSVNIQYGYNSSNTVNLAADILKYYFGEITLEQILAGDANGPFIEEENENEEIGQATEDIQDN